MPPSGRLRAEPLLAQEVSYLAASARIRSLFSTSIYDSVAALALPLL